MFSKRYKKAREHTDTIISRAKYLVLAHIPLKLLGKAEEVARIVAVAAIDDGRVYRWRNLQR